MNYENESCVIGIDPGFNGGLVIMSLEGVPIAATAMPKIKAPKGNDLDTRAILRWIDHESPLRIHLLAMEKPGPRPTDGAIQSFKFGWFSGKLCGMIEARSIPMELVSPQKWQSAVLSGSGDTKARSIAYVKRRWPGLSLRRSDRCKVDHDGIADAACIAEWARRRIVGVGATESQAIGSVRVAE